MFNGVDPFSVLGASGEPAVPGLGFRYDEDKRWPYPNPTVLEGVMEGYCPLHYSDMRAAVEAVCKRKFGPEGPFHSATPGPWKDSPRVRSTAHAHDDRFRDCIAFQAQHMYDTFGKFPATVPSNKWTTYKIDLFISRLNPAGFRRPLFQQGGTSTRCQLRVPIPCPAPPILTLMAVAVKSAE